MRQRRQENLGLFAAAYGFRPWDIDELTVHDFDQLATEAQTWIKLQAGVGVVE